MEKLNQYLTLIKDHKQIIKTAVIILVVIAAVVVFGRNGEKEEIPIELSGETIANGEAVEEAEKEEKMTIYVDIAGEVKKPGVYSTSEGARIFEIIEQAGGLTDDAAVAEINQAEVVSDGEKIFIPSEEEVDSQHWQGGSTFDSEGRININTADSTGLQEIPGVGPATAEKIIAYRDANGKFAAKEDLKNVSGIGEKTFEKIKDLITI